MTELESEMKASSPHVVKAVGVSKIYPLWSSPLRHLAGLIWAKLSRPSQEFVALNHINLEIAKGETFGLIGHNGSGKSTLLQVVCGILPPNAGTIETVGKISALLELGSGFNPEFTGRENAVLYGMILGLSRVEMEQKLEEIIAFSELSGVVDQPIKNYSSGMLMRLAFSVAVSIEPSILIVDEALAVGDAPFQAKCFNKIKEIKERGTTIIVVSHSTQMLIDLCDRCALMDHGHMLLVGDPKDICSKYLKLMFAPEDKRIAVRRAIEAGTSVDEALGTAAGQEDGSTAEVQYDPQGARIRAPQILDAQNRPTSSLVRGETYRIAYDVEFDEDVKDVRYATLIKTLRGVEVGGRGIDGSKLGHPDATAGSKVRVTFEFTCTLTPGDYTLNMGVNGEKDGERLSLHRRMNVLVFNVIALDDRQITGLVDFDLKPSLQSL